MFVQVCSLVFHLLLALTLLCLPGLALLRLAVPHCSLGFLSRVAIAPGVTVTVTTLLFVWCDLIRFKPGPALPWALLALAAAVLVFVPAAKFRSRLDLPVARPIPAAGVFRRLRGISIR